MQALVTWVNTGCTECVLGDIHYALFFVAKVLYREQAAQSRSWLPLSKVCTRFVWSHSPWELHLEVAP
jgi:hypothetical protein